MQFASISSYSTFFYPILIYGSKKFWLQQNFPLVRPSLNHVGVCLKSKTYTKGHLRVPKTLTFQKDAIKGTAFLVLMSFSCIRMKNHFHIKGWALTLVLIQRRAELGNSLLCLIWYWTCITLRSTRVTSFTWLYCGLRCKPNEVTCF